MEENTVPTKLPKGLACQTCRTRKVKCDAARPICTPCLDRGSDCSYVELVQTKKRGPDRTPRRRRSDAPKKTLESDELSTQISQQSDELGMQSQSPGPSTSALRPGNDHPGGDYAQVLLSEPSPLASMQSGVLPPDVSLHQPNPWNFELDTPTSIGPSSNEDGVTSLLLSFEKLSSKVMNDNRAPGTGNTALHTSSSDRSAGPTPSQNENPVMSSIQADNAIIVPPPSLVYQKKTWWDQLLTDTYASEGSAALHAITSDLNFLFRRSDSILAFFHVGAFYRKYIPQSRGVAQNGASVVLACLALSNLMQSSEDGRGQSGRDRALSLQTAARSSLDAAINAQTLDPSIVQAAIVLAVFELCPHPLFSEARVVSALRTVDSIIGGCGLSYQDVSHPTVSVFPAEIAPVLLPSGDSSASIAPQCVCDSISICGPPSNDGLGWSGTPVWDESWSEVEVEQEQSRRVVWSALRLVSEHIAHQATFARPSSTFFVSKPSNFALFFPGENLIVPPSSSSSASTPSTTGKNTVWALYLRAMFLWNYCACLSGKQIVDPTERATFSQQVWAEANIIEAALDQHTCKIEECHSGLGRYYLQYARTIVDCGFRTIVPSPGVRQIVVNPEWVDDWQHFLQREIHSQVARSFIHSVACPFTLWFLVRELARLFCLWSLHPSTLGTESLRLGARILSAIGHTAMLFPSLYLAGTYQLLEARFRTAEDVQSRILEAEDREMQGSSI